MDKDMTRFDREAATNLIERNAVMLEEAKDTITAPASFMIRTLACIHSLRNRRSATQAAAAGNDSESDNASREGNNNNDDMTAATYPRTDSSSDGRSPKHYFQL
ncbi:uncharacterized protein LOC129729999 [Wyeomyia smithii]|uniref:uncharacterized protein LOC129729999 n=1 Tax=Wyeomyia smithii TaxID=174621 RepID=UPI002467E13F|nr:uncharacterized protein LOC129729999 [Wyeomyia smithii]